MAELQIKRGKSINLPDISLKEGEPAISLDTGKLYIGNGTDKILINPDITAVQEAVRLSVPRKIALSGDVLGSADFDGSTNISIDTSLAKSGVTSGSYPKVTVNESGIVTGGEALAVSDIPQITIDKISNAGTAASRNVGVLSGNVPLLDANGKLDVNVIPATAITEVFVVNSESAMLALNAQGGDVCVRTDINRNFILKTVPATITTNWQELLSPTGGGVTTVNGKTGIVVLTADELGAASILRKINGFPLSCDITLGKVDIGLANVTNESKAVMFTSPVFTGSARAVTPDLSDNSVNIATTAFVKGQGFLSGDTTIDGGTF